MKLPILALMAITCLIAAVRSAEEEYDYEEEPAAAAAPITPAPARSNSARLGGLLSSRGRVNVPGRKSAGAGPPAAPATSAQSTTARPLERSDELEEEIEDEEDLEENQEQQDEIPTTTTESSKKVRGGVRPFRSNQDLLAALKRIRGQGGAGSPHRESSAANPQPATESTTAKSKASTQSRGKSSNAASETKSSGRGRFGGSRGGKPLQEEVEETQREEVQVKPKPYRRG